MTAGTPRRSSCARLGNTQSYRYPSLTFSFWVRVLLQEALEELPGIGPGLGAARFPAFESRKRQIKKMRPEKGHRFGLGKPVVLTPENK